MTEPLHIADPPESHHHARQSDLRFRHSLAIRHSSLNHPRPPKSGEVQSGEDCIHIIRLHGPWEYEPLARTRSLPDGSTVTELDELPPGGRIQIPADWTDSLGSDFRGRVRYTRRFGRPTGLETVALVQLVLAQIDAFGTVELNGKPLVQIPCGKLDTRVDITHQLQPRNELRVEVELPRTEPDSPPLPRPGREDRPGGLIGEVRLEIFELGTGSADNIP